MIRSNVKVVSVYNEGLRVYLHDPQCAGEIIESNPVSITGFGGEDDYKTDKALKVLTSKGKLVVFEMYQDVPVEIGVIEGLPMTKEEMKKSGLPWLKAVETFIDLPSGVLRIDTDDTFRLSNDAQHHAELFKQKNGRLPNDDEIEAFGLSDRSGEYKVHPGKYCLVLNRIDQGKVAEDPDRFTHWDAPCYFITLTPLSEKSVSGKIPAFIPYEEKETLPGYGKARVIDGKFQGRVLQDGNVNMRWSHLMKLGVIPGQVMKMSQEGKDIFSVFLGGLCPQRNRVLFDLIYRKRMEACLDQHPDWQCAAIVKPFQTEFMTISSLREKPSFTFAFSDITIDKTEHCAFDPDLLNPQDFNIPSEKPAMTCKVLFSSKDLLVMSVPLKQFKALTRKNVWSYKIELNGLNSMMVMSTKSWTDSMGIQNCVSEIPLTGYGFFTVAKRYWGLLPVDKLFTALFGSKAVEELVKLVKTFQKNRPPEIRMNLALLEDQYRMVKELNETADPIAWQCVTLYRKLCEPWRDPGVLFAHLQPHWQNPQYGILMCKPLFPSESIDLTCFKNTLCQLAPLHP